MKHTTVYALVALAAIGYASAPAQAAAGRGSIRGVVMDSSGAPLVGAAIMVLEDAEAAASKVEKIIRRASTDAEGKFNAAGIVPGRYKLKAEAEGFKPVEVSADVKPNKVTVFDSILLRRVTALNDETTLNVDSKYAARQARGTIFHYDESGKNPPSSDATVALTPRSTDLHGAVNSFAQSTPSGSFFGSNFAVSEQLGRAADLIVSGQVGYGKGAPQSLRALTTAGAGNSHRVSVARGMGGSRLPDMVSRRSWDSIRCRRPTRGRSPGPC